jgi:hypothetical protein
LARKPEPREQSPLPDVPENARASARRLAHWVAAALVPGEEAGQPPMAEQEPESVREHGGGGRRGGQALAARGSEAARASPKAREREAAEPDAPAVRLE